MTKTRWAIVVGLGLLVLGGAILVGRSGDEKASIAGSSGAKRRNAVVVPPLALLAAEPVAPPQDPVDAYDDEPEAEAEAEVAAEDSLALTRPVIAAIRGDFSSGAARRDAMLQALRNSGPTNESWTATAPSTFAGFRHGLRNVDGVVVSASHTECFRAGCVATVHFADRTTYERAAEGYRKLREENPSHGGRVQTPGVELADGRVEASWIVLRPRT